MDCGFGLPLGQDWGGRIGGHVAGSLVLLPVEAEGMNARLCAARLLGDFRDTS